MSQRLNFEALADLKQLPQSRQRQGTNQMKVKRWQYLAIKLARTPGQVVGLFGIVAQVHAYQPHRFGAKGNLDPIHLGVA